MATRTKRSQHVRAPRRPKEERVVVEVLGGSMDGQRLPLIIRRHCQHPDEPKVFEVVGKQYTTEPWW